MAKTRGRVSGLVTKITSLPREVVREVSRAVRHGKDVVIATGGARGFVVSINGGKKVLQ